MTVIKFDNCITSDLSPRSRATLTSTVTPRQEVTNVATSVTNGLFENTTRKWSFIVKENNHRIKHIFRSGVDCSVVGYREGKVTVDLPESPFLIVSRDSAFSQLAS